MNIKCSYVLLHSHLSTLFKDVSDDKKPKAFKTLLATSFSVLMEQDIPEGGEAFQDVWPWPNKYNHNVQRNLLRRNRRKRYAWNLMQCKVLAAPVPKEMVQQAYEKHGKQLSTVVTTKPELLEKFRDFVKPWANQVAQLYRPVTKLAKQAAYYGTKRSEGGIKKNLSSKVTRRGHYTVTQRDLCRLEPVVIHLTGAPGVGKSTIFNLINKRIAEAFGKNTRSQDNYVYWRSAATDHWDGYTGQLIAGIDDFGFTADDGAESEMSTDKQEVIQLVSSVKYRPPMADLKDKGRNFTSEFLALSSNKGGLYAPGKMNSRGAYARRVLKPFFWIIKLNGKTYVFRMEAKYCHDDDSNEPMKALQHLFDRLPEKLHDTFRRRFSKECQNNQYSFYYLDHICASDQKSIVNYITQWALSEWQDKDTYLKNFLNDDKTVLRQFISMSEFGEFGLAYDFEIPEVLPENKVQTHAIVEPLKVRMITKSQELAYALKPAQLAMFKALLDYNCMRPCKDGNYDPSSILREFDGIHPNYLLSGDYSAATDGLHMDISQVAIDELANAFSHMPAIAKLIRWEGGTHTIEYPEWTGVQPVAQTNGQLMGSLLSFPILCMVNAFTYCEASKEPLSEAKAMIHGDDICFHHNKIVINKWKDIAHNVGLEPSVGKNYTAKDWVSIDSQLFTREGSVLRKFNTGKFKCVRRLADETSTFDVALGLGGFSKDMIRYFAKSHLQKTPRDLDVPVSHGGLGLEFENGAEERISSKFVYWADRLSKQSIQIKKTFENGNKIVSAPEISMKTLGLKPFRSCVDEKQLAFDLDPEITCKGYPWDKLRQVKKRFGTDKLFARMVSEKPLNSLIPLPLLKRADVLVTDDLQLARLRNITESL